MWVMGSSQFIDLRRQLVIKASVGSVRERPNIPAQDCRSHSELAAGLKRDKVSAATVAQKNGLLDSNTIQDVRQ